jgi:hypothetical protein
MSIRKMPVMKVQCGTCPFREGSPHSDLRGLLEISALSDASRICHSTGSNALYRTKKRPKLCRGARDLQLRMFAGLGFISEPTDKAWNQKRKELGVWVKMQAATKPKSNYRARSRKRRHRNPNPRSECPIKWKHTKIGFASSRLSGPLSTPDRSRAIKWTPFWPIYRNQRAAKWFYVVNG